MSPRPKKAQQVQSNVNVILIVFFDCEGIKHHKFLLRSQTVNKEYYLRWWNAARGSEEKKDWYACVCVCVWGGEWLLHNDNAPVYSILLFCDFLTKHETTLIPQPLHLPDLAIANFFLFAKIKSVTKGWWFESDEEIKETSLAEQCSIPKEAFQECFQN